ncbi:MAG: CoA transferase [Clostridiales bacterium]|nr:CoA transferase [Clostridiales bacterium]
MNPLHGYKILDLTQNLCGPICTNILEDMGAEIIKFENPKQGGDTGRYTSPVIDGIASYYMASSRGKKSVIIDYNNPAHKEIFLKMVKDANVVVENFRPGSMEKFGLTYDVLKEINPGLIMTSISGYGQQGPWAKKAAYDNAVQAASGIMTVTGDWKEGPMKVGISMADVVSGLWGAIATLSAIARYERTGEGAYVDISMLDSMLMAEDTLVARYMFDGQTPRGNGNKHLLVSPSQPVPCKNNESVFIVLAMQPQFASFCEGIGHPELPQDPRFDTMKHRFEHRDELEPIICDITKEWEASDLCAMMEERRLVYSMINTIPQALELDQVKERKVLATVSWPEDDKEYYVGATPVHMSGMERPMHYNMSKVGQDTFDILSEYADMDTLHKIYDSYFEALPDIVADKIK